MPQNQSQNLENPADNAPDKSASTESGNWFPSLTKAWEKAREAKDQNFLMKVGIFFKTFFGEMRGVEQEQKEVSEATKEAVEKDLDETMEDARAAAGLSDSVEEEDKEFYDEILAMSVASKEELSEEQQTAVQTGLENLNNAVEGKSADSLDFDQAKAMGTVGIMTLSKLKKKYPEKGDFEDALNKFSRISDNSNYPLSKLLSMPVLRIFNPASAEEAGKFAASFGIEADAGNSAILSGLKEKPMKDEGKTVDFMKKYLFPNTDAGNVRVVARILNNLISDDSGRLSAADLTELTFNIAESDLKRLIEILGGKEAADNA